MQKGRARRRGPGTEIRVVCGDSSMNFPALEGTQKAALPIGNSIRGGRRLDQRYVGSRGAKKGLPGAEAGRGPKSTSIRIATIAGDVVALFLLRISAVNPYRRSILSSQRAARTTRPSALVSRSVSLPGDTSSPGEGGIRARSCNRQPLVVVDQYLHPVSLYLALLPQLAQNCLEQVRLWCCRDGGDGSEPQNMSDGVLRR